MNLKKFLLSLLMATAIGQVNAQQCLGTRPTEMNATAEASDSSCPMDEAAAIRSANALVRGSLGAVNVNSAGNVVSIEYKGKLVKALGTGNTVQGIEVDGRRYRVEVAYDVASSTAPAIVMVDNDLHEVVAVMDTGSKFLQLAIAQISVQDLPVSSMSLGDARKALKARESITENTALSRVMAAAGTSKKLCQDSTECDAFKELDMARCDQILDEATAIATAVLAGGTVAGALISGIPGAVVGAGGAGAVAALILYNAALNKAACKGKAIADWAACKMSC